MHSIIPIYLLFHVQRGFPFDDTSRWRVFKDPRSIDIVSFRINIAASLFLPYHVNFIFLFQSLLPEPVLPSEEEKKDDGKTSVKDLAKSLGLGGLFGGGNGSTQETGSKK